VLDTLCTADLIDIQPNKLRLSPENDDIYIYLHVLSSWNRCDSSTLEVAPVQYEQTFRPEGCMGHPYCLQRAAPLQCDEVTVKVKWCEFLSKCAVKMPHHFAKDCICAVEIPSPNEYTRQSDKA